MFTHTCLSVYLCVSQCSTASTHRVKSHGQSWPHPTTTGQSSSQWWCVSCSRWRASRPSWCTWSPSFPKAKFPSRPSLFFIYIYYVSIYSSFILITKSVWSVPDTDPSSFCVCQVWCCHCGCGPPLFCCRGSLFNGQGRTEGPALHIQHADVPVRTDSDHELPYHTLPSRPRPS